MRANPTVWDAETILNLGMEREEALLRQITEHVRDVFWISDRDKQRMLYVSPAYESVWGRSVASLYAEPSSFLHALHEEDRARVEAGLELQIEGRYDLEYRIVRPDGEVRWIRDRAFPITDADGGISRIAGIAQDVTELSRTRNELEARERRYRALFEHSSELLTVFDRHRKRLFLSRAAQRVLGVEPDELGSRPVMDRVHPDDLPRVESTLAEVIGEPGQPVRVEFRQRRNDGSYGIFEGVMVSLAEVPELEELGAVVMCARDVTDSRFVDPLTGLPNENCLFHHLDYAWGHPKGSASKSSVVIVDLDRFSAITTSIGEQQGDRILIEVAERLSAALRTPSMLARLHADRFAIVLDGVADLGGALSALRRLREVFETPFPSNLGPLAVSAGFGILVSPPDGSRANDVIRSAEVALAGAKRAGVGRYEVFDESMRQQALQRLEIESALRLALKSEGIGVHYQPIFNLRTGRISGFEALARWNQPGVGPVSPEIFIPLAEESELILELDMAVMRTAADQIMSWRRLFPDMEGLYVSVNLSARHFEGDSIVGRIDRLLAETGTPPSALKLEITESILISRPDDAVNTIRQLQARGLDFALDDFGTGYSSISYLPRYRIGALKIDRSFVMSLGSSGESPDLVRAIIGMAHTLGMRVIAEGIETKDQLAFLREANCEFGQGYGLARPLSAADAEALVARDPTV